MSAQGTDLPDSGISEQGLDAKVRYFLSKSDMHFDT